MVLKHELLFPVAAAINLFSVTGLMILAGLLGKGNLAADIAVIQGAILAIFHSLSANARNIILASGASESDEKNLFYFRLLITIPAVIAVYYLVSAAIEIPAYLFIGLVLRKCCEWLAELQLANREVSSDFDYASRYVQLNLSGFALLVLTLLVPSWNDYFYLAIFLWAVLPAVLSLNFIRFVLGLRQLGLNFSQLIPHMGSTTVIGVSTYIFRVLIVLLVGKLVAGQMFAAYALGGVLSSLYVYAIGPTLVLRKTYDSQKLIFLIVSICVALGLLVNLSALFGNVTFYTPIFVHAIGFSLIGGGVMILAQRQRLYILQVCKKDVFVPDALSNILLIASIPFAYFIIGIESLTLFFLWSAILAYLFYLPLSYKSSIQ